MNRAPTGFANIGWRYYLVFISVTSVMVVFMYFYFPEVSSQRSGLGIERLIRQQDQEIESGRDWRGLRR